MPIRPLCWTSLVRHYFVWIDKPHFKLDYQRRDVVSVYLLMKH